MAQSPVACVPQIYGVAQDGPGIFGWWASQSLGTFASRWTGSGWAPMGGNFQSVPQRFIIFDDGNGPRLVVAGEFDHIGGVPMPRIVAWNGTSWEGLGPIGFSPGAVKSVIRERCPSVIKRRPAVHRRAATTWRPPVSQDAPHEHCPRR
jgi:hypothetical protein